MTSWLYPWYVFRSSLTIFFFLICHSSEVQFYIEMKLKTSFCFILYICCNQLLHCNENVEGIIVLTVWVLCFLQIKCRNVIILSATNVLELEKQWDCLIELTKSGDLLTLQEPYTSKHVMTNLSDVCVNFNTSWYIWHDCIPFGLKVVWYCVCFNLHWKQCLPLIKFRL